MLEFRTSQASAATAFIFILSFPVRGQVFETVPPLSPREKTIVEDYFHPPGNPNLGLRDYGKGPDGSFGITTSRPMIHYSVSGQTKFASSEDEILHSIYCSLSGIVIARATGSSSMFIHEKRWIVTRTSFNVDSIVKAGHELSVGSSFFAIRQGGAIDENGETLAVHVRHSSDFVPGKQYLVFLRDLGRRTQISDYIADSQTIEIADGKLKIDGGILQSLYSGEPTQVATEHLHQLADTDSCRSGRMY